MKYEINGHIVEAEAELSEAEIDEIAASLGPAKEASEAPKPQGPVMETVTTAANAALSPFNPAETKNTQPIQPTSGNPFLAAVQAAGQTLQNPSRISPTVSQPGQVAGEAVEQKIGGLPGKAAGFMTSMALDPQSYMLGGVGQGVANLTDDAAKVVGEKVLAPAGEILSATKVRDIKRLFENPMEVLRANLKKSGDKMGELERKVFNVTEDETRLIAKAGDRTPGTARTVVEGLIDQGKQRAVSAGKDPSKWVDELTPGELIAGRRAASKLTTSAHGRDAFITVKDLKRFEDAFVNKGKEKALEYLSAIRENSMAQTRQAFMHLFPRNQNMSTNALRGFGSFGAAFLAGPVAAAGAAAAQAPITTGLATLAAKGVYSAGKAAGKAVSKVAPPVGLQAMKEYLRKPI